MNFYCAFFFLPNLFIDGCGFLLNLMKLEGTKWILLLIMQLLYFKTDQSWLIRIGTRIIQSMFQKGTEGAGMLTKRGMPKKCQKVTRWQICFPCLVAGATPPCLSCSLEAVAPCALCKVQGRSDQELIWIKVIERERKVKSELRESVLLHFRVCWEHQLPEAILC